MDPFFNRPAIWASVAPELPNNVAIVLPSNGDRTLTSTITYLRPLWVQKKFPELPVSTPWLDWPTELCTTYDLDTMPQELNWAGWGASEPLDEGFVVQSDSRLGKFVQAADEEHIVSGAPPLPPLSVPAKEQPEHSPAPPPVALEPQPTLPLPSEQLHQLLEAQAEDLDDPRPGDPFAGFPDDT